MAKRRVRVTITIDGSTEMDAATLARRIESYLDPEAFDDSLLEEGEALEFEETAIDVREVESCAECGDAAPGDGSRDAALLAGWTLVQGGRETLHCSDCWKRVEPA